MGQEDLDHNLRRGKQPAQPATALLPGKQGTHNAGGVLRCEGKYRSENQSLRRRHKDRNHEAHVFDKREQTQMSRVFKQNLDSAHGGKGYG